MGAPYLDTSSWTSFDWTLVKIYTEARTLRNTTPDGWLAARLLPHIESLAGHRQLMMALWGSRELDRERFEHALESLQATLFRLDWYCHVYSLVPPGSTPYLVLHEE